MKPVLMKPTLMKPIPTKPILILTAGEFGRAAGARARQRLDSPARPVRLAALPTTEAEARELVARASALAIAAWRPYPDVGRWIDDAAHAARVPWSRVVLHGTRLTCGPVVVPGQGPCFHCYQRRWASHHPAPERELVIEHAYARDPALGVTGFVAPMVEIAASALAEDLRAPEASAGRVRLVDVISGAVQETAVLGIHACPRCGLPHAGPAGTRFVEHLVPVIKELLG